jgi:hypothetical protein
MHMTGQNKDGQKLAAEGATTPFPPPTLNGGENRMRKYCGNVCTIAMDRSVQELNGTIVGGTSNEYNHIDTVTLTKGAYF